MSLLQNLFITCYRFSHYCVEEGSKAAELDDEVVRCVVSRMVADGFAKGPTMKYLSTLVADYLE